MNKNFSDITQRKIKEEIKNKLDYTKPYYARKDNVKNITTEVNNFPYNGFYRGDPNNTNISIFDRKAGFRPIENCYTPLTYSEQPEKKLYCFQTAANTVYPCYPEFLDKYNDRQKIELALNRKCIMGSP